MRTAPFAFIRLATVALAWCLLACLMFVRTVSAQMIDLSLNVFYANPVNINSGGTWELVGKSSGNTFGISGISALISNISTAQLVAPRGTVNGSDGAGFSQFFNTPNPLGFRNITIGQAPLPGGAGFGREQTAFYGVGTLTNGAPNYAGKPPNTNSIGPTFTTLMVPAVNSGIPWATGDPFNDPEWSTAARFASGSFPAGITPAFFSSQEYASSGNVFTTLGTSQNHGAIAEAAVSTIVRTNSTGTIVLPDYNDNGAVDAADYVLWRSMEGDQGIGLAADGNGDGKVDQADYQLWRTHFGAMVPNPAGSALGAGALGAGATIPEPGSILLLAIGAAWIGCIARRRN